MGGETWEHVVVDGGQAQALSDRPIHVSIRDPDGRLGPVPTLTFRRKDRIPAVLERPILLRGRGGFYGWTPDDLEAIVLRADPLGETGSGPVKPDQRRMPTIRLKRLTIAGVLWRLAVRKPAVLPRLARLLSVGSRRGVVTRFPRFLEDLAAPAYGDWLWARAQAEIPMPVVPHRPPVTALILPSDDRSPSPAAVEATRASLTAQAYPGLEMVDGPLSPAWLGEGGSGVAGAPSRVDPAEGLVLVLPAGLRLAAGALWRMVEGLASHPQAVGLYADEDRISAAGRRHTPLFKPAWSPALAETGWLRADAALLRGESLVGADPSRISLEDLRPAGLVRRAARTGVLAHLPEVLFHRPETDLPPVLPSQPRVLPAEGRTAAPVTVIIPTRDRADLLAACLDGLMRRTEAEAGGLDIIIIDNDSREPASLALFEQMEATGRVRRLALPGPFNFAAACNLGVAGARHEAILLLNNDVEPLHPDWLRQMQSELDEPGVGAVGPLLLFPDGHVQHAGVTLGAGTIARHSFHFHPLAGGMDDGLCRQRRPVSAVTAACLLTRRSLWQAVGGMEAEALAVAFNDVDYCLKLAHHGQAVIYTPHARLVHRESVSRGRDDTPDKRRRFAREEAFMVRRWGAILGDDPFHNPNLSLTASDRTLAARPRRLEARLPLSARGRSGWD